MNNAKRFPRHTLLHLALGTALGTVFAVPAWAQQDQDADQEELIMQEIVCRLSDSGLCEPRLLGRGGMS